MRTNLAITYYLIFVMTYWLSSFIGYLADIYNKPKKVKSEIRISYMRILWDVMFTVNVLTLPIMIFLSSYINISKNPFIVSQCIFHLMLIFISEDFFMYITHRLMHIPVLYRFHKKHHEYKNPISIAALYVNPIDYAFSNILPVILPCILLSSHEITVGIWIFFTVCNIVLNSHGKLGKLIDKSHYYHHKLFNYNYGTGLYMDTLMGTKFISD